MPENSKKNNALNLIHDIKSQFDLNINKKLSKSDIEYYTVVLLSELDKARKSNSTSPPIEKQNFNRKESNLKVIKKWKIDKRI